MNELGEALGGSDATPYFMLTLGIAIWLLVYNEWKDYNDDEER